MSSQFNALQVIAFPGTQQERHALQDPTLQVFSQQLKNMDERLSALADDMQVDQAWMLLQDLLLNTTQAFRKTDSRKFPPSNTTVQLREEKQHAWEKRVEAFTLISDTAENTAPLPSIMQAEWLKCLMNSWLWTIR